MHLLAYVLDYEDLAADDVGVVELDAMPLTIGRAAGDTAPRWHRAGASLRLRDRWLSSRHAELDAAGDVLVLRDVASRNGVHVDGVRVKEHPLRDGDLIEVGHTLLCYRRTDPAGAALAAAAPAFGPTRTQSPAVAGMAAQLRRVAPTREPILVLGEIGTGKEVTAAEVHAWSGRAGRYVAIDCGAVPECLVEPTLLGPRGELARADRGTIFLDEIADASPAAQAALLRAIDGAPPDVDLRWVAATHHDLLGGATSLRGELQRRLSGHVARLPTLRARREDLGLLTAHVVREAGRSTATITSTAARALFPDPFPGNIRQLRAMLRSAMVLAGDAPIEVAHLETERTRDLDESVEPLAGKRRRPPSREALAAALEQSGGNVVQAAELLDSSTRDVYGWLARAGLDLERYRS